MFLWKLKQRKKYFFWSNELIIIYWPKQQEKKSHFSKSTSFYSLPINPPSGNICNLKSMKYHFIKINFSNFVCTERVGQATCNTCKSYELVFRVLLIMVNFQTPEHFASVRIYVLPDPCTSQVQKKTIQRKYLLPPVRLLVLLVFLDPQFSSPHLLQHSIRITPMWF